MGAAIWTAIAILAASSLGSLFYLGARIDALGARLDARIDALDARIDALGARIGAQAAEIRELRTDLDARIGPLAVRLDDHIRRHAG